jgi:hypothetical protein
MLAILLLLQDRRCILIFAWNGSEEDWFIFNTDGACRSNDMAGCGGLIRNSSGFSKNLGRCNAYLTELGEFLTVSG